MQSLFGKTLKVLRPDDKGKQQIVVNCDGNEYPLSVKQNINETVHNITDTECTIFIYFRFLLETTHLHLQ